MRKFNQVGDYLPYEMVKKFGLKKNNMHRNTAIVVITITVLALLAIQQYWNTQQHIKAIDSYLDYCAKMEVVCPNEQQGFEQMYDAQDYKTIVN